MSNSNKTSNAESDYKIKGIPIKAYLNETGEFRWTPTSQACNNKENTEEILEVLNKMPDDRRAIWATRLDIRQTKEACPIIMREQNLSKRFDEFCGTYNQSRTSQRKEVK